MRTFCQSVNLEESICSCQADRLPHVGLGQRLGCRAHEEPEASEAKAAYLGVFELLLYLIDEATADLADEATIE
jgi:hypothetical protein